MLGLLLNYDRNRGKNHPDSPSFDRVDNMQGYIPGNVQIISHKANQIKNAGSIADHEAVIQYMRHYGS